MDIKAIPAYVRNVARCLADEPTLNLQDLNTRLNLLGWDDFELDGVSFYLLLAVIQDGSESAASGSSKAIRGVSLNN
jgi:hypothetical protein